MGVFLKEADALDRSDAAARISYTRLAVWGDPDQVKRAVRDLDARR